MQQIFSVVKQYLSNKDLKKLILAGSLILALFGIISLNLPLFLIFLGMAIFAFLKLQK